MIRHLFRAWGKAGHANAVLAACLMGIALFAALTLCHAGISQTPTAPPDMEPAEVPSEPAPVPNVQGIIRLFDGTAGSLNANWVRDGSTNPPAWKVGADGAMTVSGGNIVTKLLFTNFALHVEFKEPYMPMARGQGRGNSGIGLQYLYEIQVLDSFGKPSPGTGDCGAVYEQAAALVNACRPPRQWQTYDIVFTAAKFDGTGKKIRNARVTVMQNGIIVQNNREILHKTGIAENHEEADRPGPLMLQDHGNPIQYRNIWILPLPLQGSMTYQGK